MFLVTKHGGRGWERFFGYDGDRLGSLVQGTTSRSFYAGYFGNSRPYTLTLLFYSTLAVTSIQYISHLDSYLTVDEINSLDPNHLCCRASKVLVFFLPLLFTELSFNTHLPFFPTDIKSNRLIHQSEDFMIYFETFHIYLSFIMLENEDYKCSGVEG